MIKQYMLVAWLFHTPSVFAQNEEFCLGPAMVAEASAEAMQSGQSEEYVIDMLTNPKYEDTKRPAARQKIIDKNNINIARYVFTMRPTAAEARKEVYMKCMAGGLGYIDWKKQSAAARAR